MKQTPALRWRLALLIVLALTLAACERPVPRDDEPVTTEPPVTQPTAAPVEQLPEPTADTGDSGYPSESEAPGTVTETVVEPTPEGETPTDTAESPTPAPEPTTPTEDIVHTVAAGDTLYRISQQYGVTIQSIVDANSLTDPNNLEVGQSLRIPTGTGTGDTAAPTDPATGERTHIVQSGENLFRIGLQYGFTAAELASYNGLSDPTRIDVGQVIKIPPSE